METRGVLHLWSFQIVPTFNIKNADKKVEMDCKIICIIYRHNSVSEPTSKHLTRLTLHLLWHEIIIICLWRLAKGFLIKISMFVMG